MTLITSMINDAKEDEYLNELIEKIENIYADLLFEKNATDGLSKKEFFDFLRFADILSFDENYYGRNLAYKIISILHPLYQENQDYKVYANTILTRLGNFSSLSLIDIEPNNFDIFETALEKTVKFEVQSVPNSVKVFTDAQYYLFEQLKKNNHFSFSGPTSFGKSFIIDTYIKYLIKVFNSQINICILVPTRALINQVTSRLKGEINEGYRVLQHPTVPKIYKREGCKFIFVFTPERLISYFSNKDNPSLQYIFVDEAQKIVQENDSRSPLYYHAISMADRRSVNLFFASPNIPNSDIFLKLFDKSTKECMTIKESPVSQNKYFIDLITKEEWIFHELGSIKKRKKFGDYCNLYELLLKCGNNAQNIVYCNSIADTIKYALDFSKQLQNKKSKKIDDTVKLIKSYIHPDYFLIDCLEKGIGFHFGRLPQRIREKVEELFIEQELDYMFCTSTLLEGVNLPAKNIFILTNCIGNAKFKKIDFWNLAGRAGRLNKELSGNVICVRCEEKKWTKVQAEEILSDKKIENVEPLIMTGKKNFFKNLDNSINNKDFTRKNVTSNEASYLNNYANILYTHMLSKYASFLENNFTKSEQINSKITLSNIIKTNKVEPGILEQSITIKPIYQNRIIEKKNMIENSTAFPTNVTSDSCLNVLNSLYNFYNWGVEESTGSHPMVKNKSRLKYYAVLMYSWMTSVPLNLIIKNIIIYYEQEKKIWDTYTRSFIDFEKSNRSHINMIINELIADIDSCLRFKIKNYVTNYYNLQKSKTIDNIGENWADYLEYGTTDKAVIALQNIGIPRHLATFIKDNYSEIYVMSENDIDFFDYEKLLEIIDRNNFKNESRELENIFS